MEYQELITIWNSSNAELNTNVQVNRKLIKEVGFKKIKSHLTEIKWTAFFELLVGFFWTRFLVGFLIDNFWDIKFCATAILLLIFAIYSLVLNCYKLKLYFSVDTRFSVVETQKKIERLKNIQLFDIKSLYIIITLFSAPFVIVIAKAFLHIDLFALGILGKGLLYYTFGAFIIAVIVVFFLRKYPGKSFQESIAFLNELKEAEE